MKKIIFNDLLKAYPSDYPCDKKTFSNQCAIKVGTALAKCGVKTTTLVSKSRHCWQHKDIEGHVLSATELATGLKKAKIEGIASSIDVVAKDFKAQIAGKKDLEDSCRGHT